MKSTVLLPYCVWPADTGGKVEMQKHLEVLRQLGKCRIVSASKKPVGAGWTPDRLAQAAEDGYEVVLREQACRRSLRQWWGMLFAACCKGVGFDGAFGHSNPYHRRAFPPQWWRDQTTGSDIALVNYSYWAWLPSACPKVVVLLDVYSDVMKWFNSGETEDLRTADLVIVISKDEEKILNERGIARTMWSPPAVKAQVLSDSAAIGCIGSDNRHNREGLNWLEAAETVNFPPLRVYGRLAGHARREGVAQVGSYGDRFQPHRECGIMLMTTAMGMGVQIKGIEALACGRAIVARKGAMRGLPREDTGWIEVESPEEMLDVAARLSRDTQMRNEQFRKARHYYSKHLDHDKIMAELGSAYQQLCKRPS